MDVPDSVVTPVSAGELLKQYPCGQRITGRDPQNRPEVERAYRVGYTLGASRCAVCDLEDAADFEERLHTRRGDIYWGELAIGFDRWSNRRAAVLRGATQGAIEMIRARAQGVKGGLTGWLGDLRAWAAEEPIRLDWSSAKPPDPPEPDSSPLGRDDVPRRLWGEVFGMWALLPPENAGQTRSVGNIERMLDRGTVPKNTPASQKPGPLLVRLSDVHPELVCWLWPGRIALGKLTLLCGDPGLGKSFVTLDLAARVSSGSPWPDLPLLPNISGGVVLLSAEDDLADTIRPRLDAAGADVSQVVSIQAVRRTRGDGVTQEDYFDLTEDLPALEQAIQRTAECRLVIIDPLTAYLGKTDSHNNAEVRAVLAKVFDLAARHKVAVLAVTHLNKANTLPAIYRAMGSLAFVAAARAVWAVVRDDQDETGRRRLFVPVKNNLGTDDTGLAYSLEPVGTVARVAWEAEPVSMRADDVLGGSDKGPGPEATARREVEEWLRHSLADGPRAAKDLYDEAVNAHGFSVKTVKRAKNAVGAEAYREKVPGPWWWRMPTDTQGGQDDP